MPTTLSSPKQDVLTFLATHLLSVVHHLMIEDTHTLSDTKHSSSTVPFESSHQLLLQLQSMLLQNSFELLIIAEDATSAIFSDILNRLLAPTPLALKTMQIEDKKDVQHAIVIDTLSIKDFNKTDFNKRYDLACLISPELLNELDVIVEESNVKSDSHKMEDSLTTLHLHTIAMRLRDLFAHQSLLYLYKEAETKSGLRGLGYARSAVTGLDVSDDYIQNKQKDVLTIPRIRKVVDCWQFNLYDYKPQPDWLNARFWANPENFHKYRW